MIKGTENDGSGDRVLRIHFPDKSDSNDNFEEIGWNEFLEEFDSNKHTLLHNPNGNLDKLVNRD
ncbi:hypothetical protein [uncultured Pontibacter sp.]|uniref:hypothetical protein n=1 Tax=uncultured Pontibacter sp. TaxID=453356 RepID=UPI00261DE574|nr:hypothetical protein [uncultured Pontibacter sp.]